MITLTEARQALALEFTKLTELEQQLQDTNCCNEQTMLVAQIVECENNIRGLDEEVKLLEREE